MPKFSEEKLNNWRKPPSDSEETKLVNAHKMVKDAIDACDNLRNMSIRVFGQGSYANDTNVKLNSDIDINVRYEDAFFYDLPTGKTNSDFALNSPATYTYSEFKDAVETALVNKFGRSSVTRNDKCITIEANTYRVEADVVPTFLLRRYSADGSFVEGVKFISDSGKEIRNYPLQHIENGILKNSETQRRFKRLTRLYRRVRYSMMDDGIDVSDNITSFLLECLVWNVPNNIFNDYPTWTERLRQSIIHLYNSTKDDASCEEWGEVSELLYLFVGKKWSRQDVNTYLIQMWNYLEFGK
ncbi:nucleotidyltransferase [Pontibacter sp. FD36]|uniref:nucleotidyltransferase domain-containing protein n=1 Tax=Pontibacter sp. FD36 TaxID=2789860 RepID=UPI0018AB075F|nr:nucleotidyltransferase [Pontibacter sp. FD36]MBF8964052.1 nucleotidyltransferase [Pontibacter sp. FD36]